MSGLIGSDEIRGEVRLPMFILIYTIRTPKGEQSPGPLRFRGRQRTASLLEARGRPWKFQLRL
jgi:hypothetical protein